MPGARRVNVVLSFSYFAWGFSDDCVDSAQRFESKARSVFEMCFVIGRSTFLAIAMVVVGYWDGVTDGRRECRCRYFFDCIVFDCGKLSSW